MRFCLIICLVFSGATAKLQSFSTNQIDSIVNTIDSLKSDEIAGYLACGGYKKNKHSRKFIGSFYEEVIEKKDTAELLKVDLTRIIQSTDRYIFYFFHHALIKVVATRKENSESTLTLKSTYNFKNEAMIYKIENVSNSFDTTWLLNMSKYYLRVLPDNKRLRVIDLEVTDK